MFSTTFLSIKTKLALALAFVALSVSFFMVQAPQAAAQARPGASLSELEIMLQTLLAQIAALTSGANNNAAEYEAGDKIITTNTVNVRATGSIAGQVIGVQRTDSFGTISDIEPVYAGNYTWYRVNFDTGVDGWVASSNFGDADLDEEEDATTINFSISSENPDATKIITDENTATEATVFVYEIEADGNSDEEIEINSLTVGIKLTGAIFDSVIDDMFLVIDGQQFNDVTFKTVGDVTTAAFDIDGDLSIEVNDETTIEVVMAFEDGVSDFTLQAFVKEYERDLTDAEGTEDVKTFTGIAIGSIHTIVTNETIFVDSTNVRANAEGENREIGDYTIEFDVTAADQDIYIKAIATQAPKVGGLTYKVDGPSSDNVTAALSSGARSSNGYYIVREGETESFETNVWIKSTIAGSYRVTLDTLNYLNSPTGLPMTQNLLPVSDFQTKFVFLSGNNTQVVGKIDSFTASPTSVPQVKNGQQEVTLRWSSTGTGLCAIFESIKGNDLLKLTSNQKSAGSFVVKPIWNKSSQYGPRGYVIRCSDSITDTFVEALVFVKLEDVITPTVKPTPRFNGLTYPVGTGKTEVSAVFTTVKSMKTGPVVIGKINWGDGKDSSPVSALISGDETTVNLSHVYEKNGTYIITLTDLSGKSVTEKVVVTLPKPNGTSCVNGDTLFKEGTKLQSITENGKLSSITDASYVCRNGVWKIEGSLPTPKPVTPVTSVTTTYTLTDISAVNKKVVDPSKTVVDDEYTLYTITLKSKKTHSVKVFGNQQTAVRDANIKKTGYTGDIAKLLAMAKVVSTTPAPAPVVKGAATDIYSEISVTLRTILDMLEEQK